MVAFENFNFFNPRCFLGFNPPIFMQNAKMSALRKILRQFFNGKLLVHIIHTILFILTNRIKNNKNAHSFLWSNTATVNFRARN